MRFRSVGSLTCIPACPGSYEPGLYQVTHERSAPRSWDPAPDFLTRLRVGGHESDAEAVPADETSTRTFSRSNAQSRMVAGP